MKNERIVSATTDTAVLTNGKPFEIVDPVEEHDAGGTVKSKENEND